MDKLTIAIRNKNEALDLGFLLKVLTFNYREDIDEIIVIDNNSSDESRELCSKFGVKLINMDIFSYGGSANLAMKEAKNDIVLLMSAHTFPVSHDFFKLIKARFKMNSEFLAGLRCIHYQNDYKLYLEKKTIHDDLNGCGLMFACSVVNKKIWNKFQFQEDIITNEDKEWTKRVFENDYQIEFIPSIFCYNIKRNNNQLFFRLKNETQINFSLWNKRDDLSLVIKSFFGDVYFAFKFFFTALIYCTKKFTFRCYFYFKTIKN